jgi:branched-chain amino acid transport system permease protein
MIPTDAVWRKLSVAGGIAALLIVVPMVLSSEYLVNVLSLLFLYVTIAQAWNILGGYTGQLNVGQAAFFGIGALATRLTWVIGLPFYLAFPAGGIAALCLAGVIGLPSLRLRGHYFAIGTFALAIISRIVIGNIFPGVAVAPGEYVANYSLLPRYYLALSLAFAVTLVTYLVVNSRLGLGMMTTRDDEEAAEAIGVNTFKLKVIAFALSTFFTGLGGGFFAFYYISYYYYVPFDLLWCFEPLLITFVGGVATITGPILGSILFVALKEAFALTFGEISVLIFGAAFVLVVLFLPGGLISLAAKFRRLSDNPPMQASVQDER